jgi:hypothetical protein
MVALASGAMGLDGSHRIVARLAGTTVAMVILALRRDGAGIKASDWLRKSFQRSWNTLKMLCVVDCSTSQGWVPCCQTRSDLGPEKTT